MMEFREGFAVIARGNSRIELTTWKRRPNGGAVAVSFDKPLVAFKQLRLEGKRDRGSVVALKRSNEPGSVLLDSLLAPPYRGSN